ncbi:hypothetical protein ACFZBM_18300 [Streptomyces lavendulae]|uniref:Uncharacterized protein n=1 Tax=Streptomyces lavendulae subsp. lavendulae TaxID=58340 RepID=A0A2K8P7L3_STRLA|nr:hypothetical protein [Streptomyces lavendulae]ATZ22468.1 hypothetical protein SLAV_02725 [Streptomyces lavendulae subsp. lavendulae]QUQ52312.1 hypothetical protein SLLC_00755 [Streptomyces lavendulae subsp. lavendulae]
MGDHGGRAPTPEPSPATGPCSPFRWRTDWACTSSENAGDDAGVHYLITHPDWEHAEFLARDDGHWRGPGLSWPELIGAADNGLPGGTTTDPDTRLLLLLPALGDADLTPRQGAAPLGSTPFHGDRSPEDCRPGACRATPRATATCPRRAEYTTWLAALTTDSPPF